MTPDPIPPTGADVLAVPLTDTARQDGQWSTPGPVDTHPAARPPAERHRVVIDLPEGEPATLTVDGHDLSTTAAGLSLTARSGYSPTLRLDLLIEASVTVDGRIVLDVPHTTRSALVRLGWTPPPAQPPAPAPSRAEVLHVAVAALRQQLERTTQSHEGMAAAVVDGLHDVGMLAIGDTGAEGGQ